MSFSATEKVVLVAVLASVAAAIAQVWFTDRISEDSGNIRTGNKPPPNSGSSWTWAGAVGPLQMTPDTAVYQGPGNPQSNTNFNGQIFAKRFHGGGNHNTQVNYEQSYAFQTWSKNPYNNGTNATYATAVANATQDPTNQATALVLGPQIAPNNNPAAGP